MSVSVSLKSKIFQVKLQKLVSFVIIKVFLDEIQMSCVKNHGECHTILIGCQYCQIMQKVSTVCI